MHARASRCGGRSQGMGVQGGDGLRTRHGAILGVMEIFHILIGKLCKFVKIHKTANKKG